MHKKQRLISMIIGSLLLIFGLLFSDSCHNICAVTLMLAGFGFYFYFAFLTRNAFDIWGIFYAAWLVPIGMAQLRLAAYQNAWNIKTWVCYILTLICFSFGYIFCSQIRNEKDEKREKGEKSRLVCFNENRTQWIFIAVVVLFTFSVLTFLAKWYAARELPLFSGYYLAYQEFQSSKPYMGIGRALESIPIVNVIYNLLLSKGWIFLYQTWLVPCVAVYYAVKCTKRLYLRLILSVMGISTTIIPILIVSRELFLMTTICLAVVLYFLFKRRLVCILLVIVITLSGFAWMSNARISDRDELVKTFKIEERPIEERSDEEGKIVVTDASIKLPSVVIWAYTYFTSGLDNFDYLTQKLDHFYYGLNCAQPLFIITLQQDEFRSKTEDLASAEYQVQNGLTVYGILREPYADFGIPGVILFMLLWGMLAFVAEDNYLKRNGFCGLIFYASVVHHNIFLTFVNWICLHFSYLLSWAGLLLMFYLLHASIKNVDGEAKC